MVDLSSQVVEENADDGWEEVSVRNKSSVGKDSSPDK